MFAHWLRDTPLNPSTCARLGNSNVCGRELHHEIAAATGAIPRVPASAAHRSRALEVASAPRRYWADARPSPNPKRQQGTQLVGRGWPTSAGRGAENYVATFMEAAVDRSTGAITVKASSARMTAARGQPGCAREPDRRRDHLDAEPRAARRSAVRHPRVTSVDWASYLILRVTEVPAIEVIPDRAA